MSRRSKANIELAKTVVGPNNEVALGPIMVDLARQVHPLVLGEGYRRRQQTRSLAELLLAPHVKNATNRKKIVDFLSSDSGSHDYTLNCREAGALGLPVEKCSKNLYPVVSKLFKNFRDEMKLGEPFNVNHFPAKILGKTRTEFMIESARRQAIDVLLDQRLFVLDADRHDAFIHALDNPPAPGPKLRSLLRRVPAWQR